MLSQLPESIRRLVEGQPCTVDGTGCSGAQVLCFPDAVLKIRPDDPSAQRERVILAWLEGRIPAPRILATAQRDGTDYLLMSRIHGSMLCDTVYLDAPVRLCELLADGLRMLWSADTAGCPCDRSLTVVLAEAEARVAQGLTDSRALPEGFASPEQLLHWLIRNRPEERIVLSHGDYCLPNVLADGGAISGFIDLGNCGLSDAYLDIFDGWRSMERNLSGFFGGKARPLPDKNLLFDCLGIAPDWERMRYYELLDKLFA